MSLCQLKCYFYLQNADLLVCSDHNSLLKIFIGHTDNDKCNIWGLEATAIPRCIQVQHIKGIANVPVDSMSRLRAVGFYRDLDFKDDQQEFSAPFEPMTHTPLEINEDFIASNIENLVQNYEALHDLPTAQTDKAKLSPENASPTDIPCLEQNLMSLPELTPHKLIK